MKIKGDTVSFESTGIEQYANSGIIGIKPSLEISGGYDDTGIATVWEVGAGDYRELTAPEREELADYMIGLWQQYKQQSRTRGTDNG